MRDFSVTFNEGDSFLGARAKHVTVMDFRIGERDRCFKAQVNCDCSKHENEA